MPEQTMNRVDLSGLYQVPLTKIITQRDKEFNSFLSPCSASLLFHLFCLFESLVVQQDRPATAPVVSHFLSLSPKQDAMTFARKRRRQRQTSTTSHCTPERQRAREEREFSLPVFGEKRERERARRKRGETGNSANVEKTHHSFFSSNDFRKKHRRVRRSTHCVHSNWKLDHERTINKKCRTR